MGTEVRPGEGRGGSAPGEGIALVQFRIEKSVWLEYKVQEGVSKAGVIHVQCGELHKAF